MIVHMFGLHTWAVGRGDSLMFVPLNTVNLSTYTGCLQGWQSRDSLIFDLDLCSYDSYMISV